MKALILLIAALPLVAQETLEQRARRYLVELIQIDTTNPPGNETRAANYIAAELRKEGIAAEVLGEPADRQNVVARIEGNGAKRPLLMMAHTDVVPADRSLWSVDTLAAVERDGHVWGRGAVDTKGLLAAEMAILVELHRRGTPLQRDVILLAESDEEATSIGIKWMIENAWEKIDAEFAINEVGRAADVEGGARLFYVQTAEKIPTWIVMTAKGSAGHGSIPRPDNPVLHLSQAIAKIAQAEQPVRWNETTERFFSRLAQLDQYAWLRPMLASPGAALRERDPELDAALRTTVSPTILEAGSKINVIPNVARADVDVRRLPNETSEEVVERFRAIVDDPAVSLEAYPGGPQMPATPPSALDTDLYRAIEMVYGNSHPNGLVIPWMSLGATDGSYLRDKGMDVYGVPVFRMTDVPSRAHANDERIRLDVFDEGVRLLLELVLATAN